ncbi:SVP26 protein [Verticillium dahliae VdLs.17]|uniref:SVP26 protein n=1 Tax=Verticillium dahliae (strain VdLs.17 / ATCC MYA-4575 / FGSC 10137) TaxID=498257 RepID=G2WX82_VERDV|nr:SVP26 protein [Verticillium dahliae VdLs.17]EGY21337.1 SVP26 protein [Verticillium dahliae VdLs.17]KAH6707335.1 SVP26 protein [Verticillium dahliae]
MERTSDRAWSRRWLTLLPAASVRLFSQSACSSGLETRGMTERMKCEETFDDVCKVELKSLLDHLLPPRRTSFNTRPTRIKPHALAIWTPRRRVVLPSEVLACHSTCYHGRGRCVLWCSTRLSAGCCEWTVPPIVRMPVSETRRHDGELPVKVLYRIEPHHGARSVGLDFSCELQSNQDELADGVRVPSEYSPLEQIDMI